MEHTPQLYDTLVHVLSQQATWLDQRHEDPGVDDGGPDPVGVDQPDGLGALCRESSAVRAEYGASVSPLAQQ